MDTNLAQRLNKIRSNQTLVLTHHGRKSNKGYDVVIWFVVEADRMYLATSNVKRQWVRNVAVNHDVMLKAGSESFFGKVQRITDAAERERVTNLFADKYWYAIPVMIIGRALQALRIIADNTGTFEVALDHAKA